MTTGEKWTAWGVGLTFGGLLIALGAWLLPMDNSSSDGGTGSRQNDGGGAGPAATVPPAATENDSDGQPQARSGTITIKERHSVVLDTSATNWSVSNGCGDCSLWFQGDLMAGYGGDLAPLSSSDSESYTTCAAATQYQHTIKHDDISPGLRMCVRTPKGNFALVQVAGFHDTNGFEDDYVKLEVTSWF
ncbi:hypothetical protein ACQP2Y_27015 [Actinoplanes sp. CA-051413]|uniref:hypothetical protein n=1 Tax=Actinoplanes sp. CA-051413 TaxID=3239899 RepID=UPI003D96F51E